MWFPAFRFPLCLTAILAAALCSAVAAPAAAAPVFVTGQVSTADGGEPLGLVLRVRAGSFADHAAVDSAGRFAFEFPHGFAADSVELLIDSWDRSVRRYHPALVRLHWRDLRRDQRVVLVPRVWTIAAGRYAGTEVEISLERAYRPSCAGCSGFFRHGAALGSSPEAGGVPGWPGERFPLRVAFDRARSDQAVSARDSAAFWGIAEQAEEVFGRTLFRPASYAETLPTSDEGPNDVILVWVVSSIRSPGRGTIGFYREDITTASLWIRDTALISATDGPALVMHELMHTLGFGHTCSWRSVLWDSRCPRMRSPLPTPEDVAYLELALTVNELTRGPTRSWGMEAAHAGERSMLGELAADEPGR